MRAAARPYEDVVVAAPVTVPYTRHSIHSAHWFLAQALAKLIKAAGIRKSDIDGLAVSSFTLAPDTAVGFTQHVGLSPRFLEHVPMGGASAIVQLRRAARAVEAGDAQIVACVAGDANHVDSFRLNTASFSRFARDAVYPYGSGGPNGSFALLTAHYMRVYGARREDYGKLCVAQRQNALSNPLALFREKLSLEEYLNARLIADPIRLFDCVMPCAGADGFLVMRRATAKKLDLPHARLLAAIERHNAYPDDPIQFRGGWALDREALYDQAGVAPKDIDFLEAYDDYPVITLMQIEDLGFCAKGTGGKFVADGNLISGIGKLPFNTDGGGLCNNHPANRGSMTKALEAVRQLRGEAHPAVQVKNCDLALAQGTGFQLATRHGSATMIMERE
ncbi:MAG: thiolase family protein [Beijerinckiaceae bacterium]